MKIQFKYLKINFNKSGNLLVGMELLLVSMWGGKKSPEGDVGDGLRGDEEQEASDVELMEFISKLCLWRSTLCCSLLAF